MLFVNAFNVIQGGGVNVVLNFLKYLILNRNDVLVTLPDSTIYRDFIKEHARYKNLKVIWFRSDRIRYLYKFFVVRFYLNRLVKTFKATKVYSLGNIAFKCDCPQVVLVQNAYAVLDDETLWRRFGFFNRFYLKSMKRQILDSIKYADRVVVQTEAMRKALADQAMLDIKKIGVIPNVLDLSVLENTGSITSFEGTGLKLLFLSKYYPHKNFEILTRLCESLDSSLNVTITLTLDEASRTDRKFLEKFKAYPSIIKNVGPVPYSELAALYASHDGIFLPTLLESFSATYIEAMYFGKIIFTSDKEFAREICGNLAYYFDPYSVRDMIERFKEAINSPEEAIGKVCQYKTRLESLAAVNQEEVNRKLYNSI